MSIRRVKSPAIIYATKNRRRRKGVRRSYRNPIGLNFRSFKQIMRKQTFVIAGSAIGAEFFTAMVAREGFAMVPGLNLGSSLPGYNEKVQFQQFWNAGIKAIGAVILLKLRYRNAALGFGISSAIDVIRGSINQVNEWTGILTPASSGSETPASSGSEAYLDPVPSSRPPGYAADNQFSGYSANASDGIYGNAPAFPADAWS